MSDPQVFELVTLFPALLDTFATQGLMQKAVANGHLQLHATDPRDFVESNYKSVDDTPFGGGPGMVMQAEPVARAIESIEQARGPSVRVLVTPSAPRFDQRAAEMLATHSHITILCGRYEGIDDRVRESMVDLCYSLGDFVLNGGEVAALAIVEAVARLRPGVLGNAASAQLESFAGERHGSLLEHPQYTKPADWRGQHVPALLQQGDHARIDRWRHHCALARTWALRPALRAPIEGVRPWVALAIFSSDAPSPALEAQLESLVSADDFDVKFWVSPRGRGAAPEGFEGARAHRDVRKHSQRLAESRAAPRRIRFWPRQAGPAPANALSAHALADAFRCEDPPDGQRPIWIFMLRADDQAKDPPFEATYACSTALVSSPVGAGTLGSQKDREDRPKALAKPDALIDISQPAAPETGSFAASAQALSDALTSIFGPRADIG